MYKVSACKIIRGENLSTRSSILIRFRIIHVCFDMIVLQIKSALVTSISRFKGELLVMRKYSLPH